MAADAVAVESALVATAAVTLRTCSRKPGECSRRTREHFDAWTWLITLSETQDDERAIREVYEAFLRRYPYFYGYWRKFAEMERRHHHYDKCLDVYQRGVDAIPTSMDRRMSYIEYIKALSKGQRQAKRRYKAFVNSQATDRILSQQEYDEITDVVYARIKDRLNGPMFFIEEYEAQPAVVGDYEEVTTKVVRQRKHIDVALKEYRDEIIQRRHKRYMDNERES
ncbi:PRPF39 protein [Aphelenchoides avenae]|nr:PRPF39 protein [Aphelenchus avenae]